MIRHEVFRKKNLQEGSIVAELEGMKPLLEALYDKYSLKTRALRRHSQKAQDSSRNKTRAIKRYSTFAVVGTAGSNTEDMTHRQMKLWQWLLFVKHAGMLGYLGLSTTAAKAIFCACLNEHVSDFVLAVVVMGRLRLLHKHCMGCHQTT